MRHELTRIAAERSPAKRLELLHRVTDLYLDGVDTSSQSEIYLFNDIMERIVDQFSRDFKSEVSATLAILPGFPSNIVRKFANDDEIEIARPVLRNALSLSDDELVTLAKRGSQAHLTAIAGRSVVPARVTDVLIERGERGVVHTVTANHGALFSDTGMDRLLDKARDDLDLGELLVERPDLSPAVIDRLLPMISGSLLERLAERGYDVGSALSPAMVHALRQRFTTALRNRKENILQVSVVIDEIRKGHARLDESVRQIAESGRLLDVAAILGTFARLERDHVFKLIFKGQLQTVLILCRSFELSWPTLDAILALRAAKNSASYFPDPKTRAEYEATDAAAAQRAIRFLRVRQVASAQAAQGALLQAGAA